MTDLLHLEMPPPRSWEQFEELCADLFELMWSDPGLVRHGRAGQTQQGVDIVAKRGGVYPIGLQCKKKGAWPPKKLTFADIEAEVGEAEDFIPPLQEFYLLTSAVADAKLEKQVRELSAKRELDGKFSVTYLPWAELVRRISRHDQVAKKHFPVGGDDQSFTPLLATWYAKDGRLELTGEDWELAVRELAEDLHDWPTGHLSIRQRETDALVSELRELQASPDADRKRKLELREELRRARKREVEAERTIKWLYTEPYLKTTMLELYQAEAPDILRSLIEFKLVRGWSNAGECKIRISPPDPGRLSGPFSVNSQAQTDIPLDMTEEQYSSIVQAAREFPKRHYGNQMTRVVSELPGEVRTRLAIPAVLRRVERIMQDDKKTAQELELAGYLDFFTWTYTE